MKSQKISMWDMFMKDVIVCNIFGLHSSCHNRSRIGDTQILQKPDIQPQEILGGVSKCSILTVKQVRYFLSCFIAIKFQTEGNNRSMVEPSNDNDDLCYPNLQQLRQSHYQFIISVSSSFFVGALYFLSDKNPKLIYLRGNQAQPKPKESDRGH